MTIQLSNRRHLAILSSIGVIAVASAAFLIPTLTVASGPAVRLGTTSTYGVLGGSTVTNTGATIISGTAGSDIGLSPGTSYTGSSTVNRLGVDHIADGAATIAQTDLTTAYGDAAGLTPVVLGASDLAGQTILPGTYSTASGTFTNSGTLILNAGGDPTAVFIFQAASTVITGTSSSMSLIGGAQACNVFWKVGSSATLGVTSTFVGHIYASASITANTGATIYGQLLARSGAVTLDNNTIVNNSCVTPTPTATPAVSSSGTSNQGQAQDSSISSLSSSECTTTSAYSVKIGGNFPSAVANVSVNSVVIPLNQWVQTPTQVEVMLPPSSTKEFAIQIYNGRVPMLASQLFICATPTAATATPTPSATPTPVVTPTATPSPTVSDSSTAEETFTATENGGALPQTSDNNYNFLLIGAALIALGSSGFVIRKRLQK